MRRVVVKALTFALVAVVVLGLALGHEWGWFIGFGAGLVLGVAWVAMVLWRDRRERRFANPS
jgi:predicted MFS family arabinose efflux permease